MLHALHTVYSDKIRLFFSIYVIKSEILFYTTLYTRCSTSQQLSGHYYLIQAKFQRFTLIE